LLGVADDLILHRHLFRDGQIGLESTYGLFELGDGLTGWGVMLVLGEFEFGLAVVEG
jgi:hypothetical protein